MLVSSISLIVALAGSSAALYLKSATDGRIEAFSHPVKRQNESGWNPPSDIASPLKEVWDHVSSTYNGGDIFGFTNYGWDQIMDNNGQINYCVRWESSQTVSEALRTQIETKAQEAYDDWFTWVYGFNGFPFSNIKIKVVGWAVSDTSLLQGSTEGIQVYTDTDSEGIPQCAPSCGRFFHQDGDYSGCSAGADYHYDQSLWVSEDFGGGAGGDWGQRIQKSIFDQEIQARPMTYMQHEMGHTFGMDDYWKPTGAGAFIMDEGLEIVDFDGWMFRNFWYELKQNRGW
ncbi:unnamed protein product [Clonostachys solani]|uniref:Uncharacterized protein n=1 Tax=Clonostachys solani TaxID=160281 RepID=A0A9N9YZ42_9HYPO|nr:unnamed protein product [Clonostachys solani]